MDAQPMEATAAAAVAAVLPTAAAGAAIGLMAANVSAVAAVATVNFLTLFELGSFFGDLPSCKKTEAFALYHNRKIATKLKNYTS